MIPNQEKVLRGLDSCGFYDGIPNICEVTECPYRDDKCGCVHELAHDAGLLISELLKAQEPEAMDAPKPDSDIGCWYDITHNYTLEQVVSALKEQKPRLVTEADFENADENGFIPVWCEVMSNSSDPFVIKDYWNCIPIEALETAKEDGCRYWTAKPSLKQMEETPWP